MPDYFFVCFVTFFFVDMADIVREAVFLVHHLPRIERAESTPNVADPCQQAVL